MLKINDENQIPWSICLIFLWTFSIFSMHSLVSLLFYLKFMFSSIFDGSKNLDTNFYGVLFDLLVLFPSIAFLYFLVSSLALDNSVDFVIYLLLHIFPGVVVLFGSLLLWGWDCSGRRWSVEYLWRSWLTKLGFCIPFVLLINLIIFMNELVV